MKRTMNVLRLIVRIVLVAVACAIATIWLGWIGVPCVGFIYGVVDRSARARGSVAAIGSVVAWIAILGAEAARGANIRALANRMGEVMQLPAAVFAVATLVFAALLAGTAAVLGAASGDAIARSVGGVRNGSPLSRG
jgi:hypothetical protein